MPSGFYWWEWDPSFYLLRLLGLVRVVREIRTPPPRVLLGGGRVGLRRLAQSR